MMLKYLMNKLLTSCMIISISLLASCKPEVVVETANAPGVTQEKSNGPYSGCELTALGLDTGLGTPASIQEVVELINALPKPLEIPCFVSALNRPLKLNLTSSALSAQPARGRDNPRIFIMNYPLVISLASTGAGAYKMELSEFTEVTKSYKGELNFPIVGNIDITNVFDSVDGGSQSNCVNCHLQETSDDVNFGTRAYNSFALKPTAVTKIDVIDFQQEYLNCNFLNDQSYRCHIIYSIFSHGSVVHQDFPGGTPTFIESFNINI
jgi:hypothetical protein